MEPGTGVSARPARSSLPASECAERVVLKSPVLENCTPGSVRGAPGNRRPYLAKILNFFRLRPGVRRYGGRARATTRTSEIHLHPQVTTCHNLSCLRGINSAKEYSQFS